MSSILANQHEVILSALGAWISNRQVAGCVFARRICFAPIENPLIFPRKTLNYVSSALGTLHPDVPEIWF
jgi:hypothetical protein